MMMLEKTSAGVEAKKRKREEKMCREPFEKP